MYITCTFGPIGMYLLVIVSCPDGETQTCPVLLVWHPDQYTRKGLYNYTCYTYGTICRNRIGEWGDEIIVIWNSLHGMEGIGIVSGRVRPVVVGLLVNHTTRHQRDMTSKILFPDIFTKI